MARFRTRNSKRGPEVKVSDDLKTRYVGTCPVCQKRQKLSVGPKGVDGYMEMVHHGYQRPGHGSIVGDCFGVHLEPYEVSAKGCEKYQDHCKAIEDARTKSLQKFEAGEIRTLIVERRKPGCYGRSKSDFEMVSLSADSEDEKVRADFARELDRVVSSLKNEIKGWKFEQERMARLIAAWERKPVITWQEHLEQVKREKFEAGAERRAMLAAKRAERSARAEALRIKREGWEAEKQGIIAKYKALFEKLANGLESAKDRESCARMHWVDMWTARNKKGYLHFYERDLDCDEALVTLKLARIDNSGSQPWTYYADGRGFLR
jgi:hypothetical protein